MISIPSYSNTTPVLYTINVAIPEYEPYTIEKRYSDFLTLAQNIENELGEPPTVLPPPKPSIFSKVDLNLRRQQLEEMLVALMQHEEFRNCLSVFKFLDLSKQRHANTFNFTKATAQISKLLVEIKLETSTAHKRQKTAEAQLLLAQCRQNLEQLNNLTKNEKIRRQTQLTNLETQLEPKKRVSDERILGPPPPNFQSNKELYFNQQSEIKQQDLQIENILRQVQTQKRLGMEINSELERQNEMLEELDGEVHRVNGKLNQARRGVRNIK